MSRSTPPSVRGATRAAFLFAGLLGLSALGATGAAADRPSKAERGMRAYEAKVLGPDHAAQHAAIRKADLARLDSTRSRGFATDAVSTDPAVSGRWSTPFSIPVMGIHAAVLPTGKVMWWSYPINPNRPYGDPSYPNTAQAWLWDPGTGVTKRVDPPLVREPDTGQMVPANIWCSGQSFLADGRVLVTGGNLRYQGAGNPPSPDYAGLNKVFTFNPWNETWTEQPDMPHGRWYPSQVLLPDGRSVILSGYDETGQGYASLNDQVDLFTPSANMNGRGTLTTLGTRNVSGAPPTGGLYPHLAVMPSGRILLAGPDPDDSWFLNDPGQGNVFAWSDFANPTQRLWGAGVLRPGGPSGSTKYTLLGGSDPDFSTTPATNYGGVRTTATFDEANSGAGWQAGAQMNIGRSHLNTVLLPDGSMVTVGGGVGRRDPEGQWAADPEQRQVEIFDPAANSWRLGAAQAESRAYHSTALLLPDGRVISAGDDVNGGIDRDTAEIYEPPYLFKGARPAIGSAPTEVTHGQSFAVNTSGATVQRAVLVAPGATTHANDMNQRVVELSGTARAGGLDVVAPANGKIAPPGYYMLFALSDQGVPSVARWVKLTPSSTPPPPAGPVAAYSFNEGTGTTAGDASGSGNAGAISGASWLTAGKNGKALSFDGVNDWVTVADSNSLDLASGKMTLEAWVRPQVADTWRTVLMKERLPGAHSYTLYGGVLNGEPGVEVGSTWAYGPSKLPVNAWSHLAATFDGSVARLYVNGAQVASRTGASGIPTSTSPLRIGGNSIWGEYFKGDIDDIRIYDRVLSASEIQSDRDTPVGGSPPPPPPPDTTPPTVSASAPSPASGTVNVTATASDNVGVAGVQFKVDGANLGAEDTSAPYSVPWNTTTVANGSHSVTAVARDAAGNSTTATPVTVNVQNDKTAPTVTVSAASPASGTVNVTATASDNVGVSGVQFKVDGANLGAEDTSAPYSVPWNTTTVANGSHSVTAVARDAAGNSTTATPVTVTVSNATGTAGLVAAYSFNEGSGTTVADASTKKNTGTVAGAAWTTAGKNGGALSFDGVNDWVTVPDSSSLDLTNAMTLEAWLRPTTLSGWQTAIMKENLSYLVYSLYGNSTQGKPNTDVNRAHLFGNTTLPASTWTHLASTYDGSTIRMYVNGTQVSSKSASTLMPNSSGPLRIGGNAVWNDEFFHGLIDDVRVYNRALSAAEIQSDRATAVPPGSL